MRVQIDPERCQGHLRCVAFAPAIFEADEQGFGTVSVDKIPADEASSVMKAIAACPEQAITVVVEHG